MQLKVTRGADFAQVFKVKLSLEIAWLPVSGEVIIPS